MTQDDKKAEDVAMAAEEVEEESGASESETESSAVEDETEPENTPEELKEEGRKMLASGEYTAALSKLAWALQLKTRSLGNDSANHPELAPFYLDYGNALLTKEENSNDLFDFLKEGEGGIDKTKAEESGAESADEGGSKDDKITDEQLAWENLELARVCYSKKMAELGDKVDLKTIEDASYVTIRLGDMLMLQDKADEAVKEFESAVSLRKKHNMPYTALQSGTVALAQAYLFSGQKTLALATFKVALKYVQDHLAGVGGFQVPEDKVKDFQATVEDLQAQIADTTKTLAAAGEAKLQESPQGRAKLLPPHSENTTSDFDKPVLGDVKVMELGVLKGSKCDGASSKKRRVDLSTFHQAAKVASQ